MFDDISGFRVPFSNGSNMSYVNSLFKHSNDNPFYIRYRLHWLYHLIYLGYQSLSVTDASQTVLKSDISW